MSNAAYVNDAKVMSKGQITIPKKIRAVLGVESGDRVTFIVDDKGVHVVNSAIYALERFQEQMKGQAEDAGFRFEEDIDEWITNSRRERMAELLKDTKKE